MKQKLNTLSSYLKQATLTHFKKVFAPLLVTLGFAAQGQVVYTQSFDGTTFVPTGWTDLSTSGSAVWSRVTSGSYPTQSPHTGAGEAMFNSYSASTGVRSLITPPFTLVNNTSGAAVSFWMYRDGGYSTTADLIDVYYNTSASMSGATLLGTVNRSSALSPTVATDGWYQYSYTIPSSVTSSSVYFILQATSAWGNNIFIDDVSWTAYPPMCSGTPAVPSLAISSASGCPSNAFILSATGTPTDAGVSYQWQSSTSLAGTYAAITGGTNTSLSTSTATTTFYRLVTTCSVSALSSTSSPVSYSVVNPGPCVCTTYGTSNATSTSDEEILGVRFGTLNNTSICGAVAPGAGSQAYMYSNYAGYVTGPDICKGSANAFTITVGTCGGNYSNATAIYIDYNQNGSFADAGENVYLSGSSTSGPHNEIGSITIPMTALTGLTRMRVIVKETSSPSSISPTGTYSWGETEDYCINIIAPATITLASSTGSVCPGASFTTTASGATTYSITGGAGSVVGSNLTFNPIVNTTYTVNGTGANGCVVPLSIAPTATVATLASPTLAVTSPTGICAGSSATLSVSGANTYTWLPSTVASSIVVSPAATTVYTVTGTGTNVCNGVKNVTLAVNPLPTVSVASGTICAGKVFTMTPSGASTYSYSSSSNTVSPSVTTSYSITGYSNQLCPSASPAVATVSVFALPVVSAAGGTICEGSQFVILPSGASNYTFVNSSNPVTPTVTTSYSVIGSNSLGCVSLPVIATVTVFPKPTLTVSASNTVSCAGYSVNLNVSGASTYTWVNSGTGAAVVVTPTTTSTYNVFGVDALGCLNSSAITISVNPVPNINVTATKTFVCVGESTTLTATGAPSFAWSNGGTNSFVAVSPSTTATYTVIGTNIYSCSTVVMKTVQVNSLTLSTSGNTTVCQGSQANLSASGVNSYTWSTGSVFPNVSVTPSVTTTYTVNATGNNCPFSTVVTVTVNPKPNVVATITSTMICTGETATLSVSGASTYTWNNSLGSAATVTVSPTTNITYNYSATGVDANGCSNTSNGVSLVVDRCTGVAEKSASMLSVYPNPGTGLYTVSFANNGMKSLDVTDMTGRIILSQTSGDDKCSLNLTSFANGIYFVTVRSGEQTDIVRIVKY